MVNFESCELIVMYQTLGRIGGIVRFCHEATAAEGLVGT